MAEKQKIRLEDLDRAMGEYGMLLNYFRHYNGGVTRVASMSEGDYREAEKRYVKFVKLWFPGKPEPD